MKKLSELYNSEVERVGFVMKNGDVVEVENQCDDPANGFDVSGEDILKYGTDSIATWHTHPDAPKNLSVGDYHTFLSWPSHRHYIIGNDGVAEYYVEDGEVLIA